MRENRVKIIVISNVIVAVGMATSVFTGQLVVSFETAFGDLIFPASNIFFALLTFPVTDIIADTLGKKEAQRIVWMGFISQFLTIAIVQISLMFPGDISKLAPFALGGWKVLLGSSVAYLTAQYWDVWIFHWIKEKYTGEKHLWIRNNVSTFTSQFINSFLFIAIVFGPEMLIVMIPGSIAVKLSVAIIDTPMVYAGRNWVAKKIGS